MELIVLNPELVAVDVIDTYESFIWTDRYFKVGDFELYAPVSDRILSTVRRDDYILRRDSDRGMIVEDILIKSDAEEGNHITIRGRSFESILDRRVVWGRLILHGSLQDGIETLLNECIINPSDPDRKIHNFIFEASTDPSVVALTLNAQYTGGNLLEIVEKICTDAGIGFKVTLNDANQFVFQLYRGLDRSYAQTENPYVIFSPNFENIVNSNYFESSAALKNVALIAGEGEGVARRYSSVGGGSGMNRREIFIDARDISSGLDDGATMSEEEYTDLLNQRGHEKLTENTAESSFDGQVEATTMFVYGSDFFIGDIVQIANEYGHETRARIVEIITSESGDECSTYPTFATVT